MSQARRSTCCAPTAPRSSSRRPTSPPDSPRVLLPRRRPPDRGDPRRLPAQPVLQPGQPGRPTTRRPAPRSGSRPAGAITHLVVGVGTGGTITGTGALPQGAQPATSWSIGADPEGSIYSGGEDDVQPVPRRGRRRGLLARDVRPARSSTAGSRSRDKDSFLTTRRLAMAEGILAGGSGGLARPRRARGRARRSTTPTRWSS